MHGSLCVYMYIHTTCNLALNFQVNLTVSYIIIGSNFAPLMFKMYGMDIAAQSLYRAPAHRDQL